MATPDYLIDKTPLIGIQYDLKKAEMYGARARLGFLKVGAGGGFVSIISGGLPANWQARKSPNPAATLVRLFDVLLIAPVTVDICDETVALQVNGVVFTKIGQTPWTGETPQQWIFETEYTRQTPVTL